MESNSVIIFAKIIKCGPYIGECFSKVVPVLCRIIVNSLRLVFFKGGSIGSGADTDPDLTTLSRSAAQGDFPRGGQLGLGRTPTQTFPPSADQRKICLSLNLQGGVSWVWGGHRPRPDHPQQIWSRGDFPPRATLDCNRSGTQEQCHLPSPDPGSGLA